MTEEKVELGRHLFYDTRLSGNQTQSCASCHLQELAFTDGRARAVGSTGERHHRSSMSLANVAYASRLTWAHPHLDRLEDQALAPMFGDLPVELGLGDAELLTERLASDPLYPELFSDAFEDEPQKSARARTDGAGAELITLDNVLKALATFERTLISGSAPYDRFLAGEAEALSEAAQRGMKLFLSERLECFHCHGGFLFSDSVSHAGLPEPERAFHNNGLYNVDGEGGYPQSDQGIFELTGRDGDMGKFKAPTLRNIAVTAPYMHDGSIATLEEVLRHYENGGRTTTQAEPDGADSPLKDELVGGFILSDSERSDLLEFLHSLTDQQFLTDERFADPRPARTSTQFESSSSARDPV